MGIETQAEQAYMNEMEKVLEPLRYDPLLQGCMRGFIHDAYIQGREEGFSEGCRHRAAQITKLLVGVGGKSQ